MNDRINQFLPAPVRAGILFVLLLGVLGALPTLILRASPTLQVAPLDWGDAPDPSYPTLQTNEGANHLLGSDVYLGTCVDAELDGQPTTAADGDNTNDSSPVFGSCIRGDEDGVSFVTPLYVGKTASIYATSQSTCTLSAWIDFNGDGDWLDNGEALFPDGQALEAGLNDLDFSIPADAVAGDTYARFRCTTDGVVSFTGQASDGEVEDYRVTIDEPLDLGDAPDSNYSTLLASGGASHRIGSDVYLGTCVDAELDGQPSTAANGDDVNVDSPVSGVCIGNDDEDGVMFTTAILTDTTADVQVMANSACTLSAWIDFNIDGDWLDAGEDLFPGGQTLDAGLNNLSFWVPTDATAGDTYARFRCTTDGPVPYNGEASDGEVEDYRATIGKVVDFGDAPDPDYPTLLANTGASHMLGSGVYLGSCVDAESDGQPTAAADGDDATGSISVFGVCSELDDEDGVLFASDLFVGETADLQVVASSACTLSAWIDFNADGDWSDAGETLFPGGQVLSAGINSLGFAVPAEAITNTTYARFRCTTDGPVSFTGEASDGEVEDYQVTIHEPLDLGDAPDPDYATLLTNGGASHVLGSDVYLGSCVDGEMDGQPAIGAGGDDTADGTPVSGSCVDDDDEDGVVLTTLLTDTTAYISVTASSACTLSAWIDFDGNGDWLDAGEDLFPGGQALKPGVNRLSFPVPAGAAAGTTYARFRCTTDGPVLPTGKASDGEIEDYQVLIGSFADFGDAPDPNYPTLLTNGGASHLLSSDVYLGTCVDAESDGQPTAAANGDDENSSAVTLGNCAEGSDENGVIFVNNLLPGGTTNIQVTANSACTLSAWIDFNGDGDWLDADEDLFPGGQTLSTGNNDLSFPVPTGVTLNTTYARFRCTTDGVVPPTGQASDGEVEDYKVAIPLDLGDAPDPSYPTLLASAGASHVLNPNSDPTTQVYLGSCVDTESDGQPSNNADSDDATSGSPVLGTCVGDDEDGIVFATALLTNTTAYVTVTNAPDQGCTLSAWIDFNGDGDWADAGEDLFPGGQVLNQGSLGPHYLGFPVPAGATVGDTYARFRCASSGVVSYTGQASDGEVEDYRVVVGSASDFGDAPDPSYPTLQANGGASHQLGSVYLGDCVDVDPDGRPSTNADGDDTNAAYPIYGACEDNSDEDGVTFLTNLEIGETVDVSVKASSACILSAWIDFNIDGDWSDAGEDLFPGGQALNAGINNLNFSVPAGAVEGKSYARFRCTTDGAVPFTGAASDGEVEDYAVLVGRFLDFGDAPDPDYTTLLTNNGANHILDSDVYLGSCVDAEPDGQPTATANGDDAASGTQAFGTCEGDDDEDGVTFATDMFAGGTTGITVMANSACRLYGWIDFNQDGDWTDSDELLFPGGQALTAGANNLGFWVPTDAISGTTYARFRCTTDAQVSPTGQASDGEVEDYQVTVHRYLDLGDAPDPSFPTLQASTGASHLLGSGVYLGDCVDAESDGQPTAIADGDDTTSGTQAFGACEEDDDEDGVIFATPLYISTTADINVTASSACTLSAWIDFDGDGTWSDTNEALFPGGQSLSAGVNSLSFPVPAGAVAGNTYARFRCTTDGPVAPTGEALDGEVEDYYVEILALASMGDYVWFDIDADGIQDSVETGISGISVNLYTGDGTLMDTAITNVDGGYNFTHLVPDDYAIEFIPPIDYVFSPQDQGADDAIDSDADPVTGRTITITLDSGENALSWDAGLIAPLASLGDYVWNDTNGDGVQDADEPGVNGVRVNLWHDVNNDGSLDITLATITTANKDGQDGHYEFANLPPDVTYQLEFVPPSGYVFGLQDQGTDDSMDSDVDHSTGRTPVFTPGPGENNLSLDAGIYMPALAVDKSVSPTTVEQSQIITYTISVTNAGTVHLSSVAVSDTLDNGLAFISANPVESAVEGQVLSWADVTDGAGLAPQEKAQITLLVTATSAGAYDNVVKVISVHPSGTVTGTAQVQVTVIARQPVSVYMPLVLRSYLATPASAMEE